MPKKLPALSLTAIIVLLIAAVAQAVPAQAAPTGRIIGGNSVKASSPYANATVALVDRTAKSARSGHICGGVLIAPTIALTTRTCVDDAPFTKNISRLQVVQGAGASQNLPANNWAGVERRQVTSVHRRGASLKSAIQSGGDLAIVRFAHPFSAGTPVPLINSSEKSWGESRDNGVFIYGWGAKRDADFEINRPVSSFPTALQEAEIPMINSKDCALGAINKQETQRYLCGGMNDDRSTIAMACHGDVGGPVIASAPSVGDDNLSLGGNTPGVDRGVVDNISGQVGRGPLDGLLPRGGKAATGKAGSGRSATGKSATGYKLIGIIAPNGANRCLGDTMRIVRISSFLHWINLFINSATTVPSATKAPTVTRATRLKGDRVRIAVKAAAEGPAPKRVLVSALINRGVQMVDLGTIGATGGVIQMPPTRTGKITIFVRGIDAAGNETALSPSKQITVRADRTKPKANNVSVKNLSKGNWRVSWAKSTDNDRIVSSLIEGRKGGKGKWQPILSDECANCWINPKSKLGSTAVFTGLRGGWQFRLSLTDRAGNNTRLLVKQQLKMKKSAKKRAR